MTTLTVRATVLSSVDLIPREQLRLSDRRPNLRNARMLIRKAPDEKGELVVTELESSAEWFSATVEKLVEATPEQGMLPAGEPGDWLLEVELTGKAPYGRVQEEVRFKTGLAGQPNVTVPITGQFAAPVTYSKERIVFPSGAPNPLQDVVLVSVENREKASGLVVTTEPEGLTARLEPSGARYFKLHVEWDEPRPLEQGSVTLTLGEDSFRIPVERAPAP